MHSQPDSLFIKPDDSACIVQCACGNGHYHGQIEFYIDPGLPNDDPAWAATCASHCYISVAMPPVSGYWHGWLSRFWPLSTLCRRLKVAWDILLGRRFEYDFDIGAQTVGDLGEWLARAKAKADAVIATKPGEKMTLAELRAKIKETDYFWDAVKILNDEYCSDVAFDYLLQELLAGKPLLPGNLALDQYIAGRAMAETPITREEIMTDEAKNNEFVAIEGKAFPADDWQDIAISLEGKECLCKIPVRGGTGKVIGEVTHIHADGTMEMKINGDSDEARFLRNVSNPGIQVGYCPFSMYMDAEGSVKSDA
jgi:hypothetical protein